MSRNVAAGEAPATAESEANESAHGTEPPWEEITRFLDRYGSAIRGTARRYSVCSQDAEDAYQRGIEILIRHAPKMGHINPSWMHTVVRHEALRLGRLQRRSGLVADSPEQDPFEPGEQLASTDPERADPAQLVELRDEFSRFRQAFKRLKRSEQRALCLIGEGYSYSEIAEITGWSRTKINRHLSEGRARMRQMLERIESGHRCAELAGRLSRFCDGEADADEIGELQDHLEQCLACRSALHRYRSLPRQAAALFPAVPAAPSLGERLQELGAWVQSALPGRGNLAEAALIASGNGAGTRGNGMAALAKLAIVCVGAGGGTAACVAGGVLPVPTLDGVERALGAKTDATSPQDAEKDTGPPEPSIVDPPPVSTPEATPSEPAADSGPAAEDVDEAKADPIPKPTPAETEFGPEGSGGANLVAPTPSQAPSEAPAPQTQTPGTGESATVPKPAAPNTMPPISGGGEFAP